MFFDGWGLFFFEKYCRVSVLFLGWLFEIFLIKRLEESAGKGKVMFWVIVCLMIFFVLTLLTSFFAYFFVNEKIGIGIASGAFVLWGLACFQFYFSGLLDQPTLKSLTFPMVLELFLLFVFFLLLLWQYFRTKDFLENPPVPRKKRKKIIYVMNGNKAVSRI